jgi:hypothetical protein
MGFHFLGPLEQILIGSIPTLFPARLGNKFPAFHPLAFHPYLLDSPPDREDTLNYSNVNTVGDGRAGYWEQV